MSNKKPNILFIMDDQHRWDYLGSMGSEFISTPVLDRLARNGMQFSTCTTNSPVCAPARIALATGMQPHRLGALSNRAMLPARAKTYYQRLRNNNYYVGCVGKLDLAKPHLYHGRYGDRPCSYKWGFTHPLECEGKGQAGKSKMPIGPYTFFLHEKGLLGEFVRDFAARKTTTCHDSILPTEAFHDVFIGREAVKWIQKIPSDFPWHLFVSFTGPHNPFDPPKKYADRYRGTEMPEPIPVRLEGKPSRLQERNLTGNMSKEEIADTRRQYCASIELIDSQIGEILDALKDRGMHENTYVIFASDHGEMLGDFGAYLKQMPYEAALRVPLIIAGPGIEPGSRSDEPVELIDVNATICDLAGLRPQPEIDAESLLPVLLGETKFHREDAISAISEFRLIRTKSHKYVRNQGDVDELYDLNDDPLEMTNIANRNPALVRELSDRMNMRFGTS